jgi:hypothetical protein
MPPAGRKRTDATARQDVPARGVGGRPFGRHKGLLRNEAITLRRYFALIRWRRFHGILVTLWRRR